MLSLWIFTKNIENIPCFYSEHHHPSQTHLYILFFPFILLLSKDKNRNNSGLWPKCPCVRHPVCLSACSAFVCVFGPHRDCVLRDPGNVDQRETLSIHLLPLTALLILSPFIDRWNGVVCCTRCDNLMTTSQRRRPGRPSRRRIKHWSVRLRIRAVCHGETVRWKQRSKIWFFFGSHLSVLFNNCPVENPAGPLLVRTFQLQSLQTFPRRSVDSGRNQSAPQRFSMQPSLSAASSKHLFMMGVDTSGNQPLTR